MNSTPDNTPDDTLDKPGGDHLSGFPGLHGALADRYGRWGDAGYSFVACLVALAVSGLAAYLLRQPLIFPSLGPTAYLFFERPMSTGASPRNTLIGHGVAIVAGGCSLTLFGLFEDPSILAEGVSLARIGAGAFSVAVTVAILTILDASHPPAGATVLIISLGLFSDLSSLANIAVGVIVLVVVGWVVNRSLGVPVPVWKTRE
ncbi:MAG: HPP family protein [Rubrobacter sp.]